MWEIMFKKKKKIKEKSVKRRNTNEYLTIEHMHRKSI